jgi:hypothetical protein
MSLENVFLQIKLRGDYSQVREEDLTAKRHPNFYGEVGASYPYFHVRRCANWCDVTKKKLETTEDKRVNLTENIFKYLTKKR